MITSDKIRAQLTEKRRKEADKRFGTRLKAAVDHVKDLESKSYCAGILDAAAGPTAEVKPTVFTAKSNIDVYSRNQFVAIQYGPIWYPCRIESFHSKSNEVEIEVLYTRNEYKTFFYKEGDDPGYEGLFWESASKIMCRLPEPTVISSGNRVSLTFPVSVVSMVNEELAKLRTLNRKPRR